MNAKKPNYEVGSNFKSHAHHCYSDDHCSLLGITVDICPCCGNCHSKEDSMCGSYSAK